MKIRGMRWGYDGGGVACGPVPGSTIVELCVTNPEQHNFFVTVSRLCEYEHVYISPLPAFDLLIHGNHYDVDTNAEWEKVSKYAIEEYDYEIGDEPEEMFDSAFAKVIHLGRLALQAFVDDSEENDQITADEFIAEYIDENIDSMDLPALEHEEEELDDEYIP